MCKYAGKENLFMHKIEIPQVSEGMKTVWFSDRPHTCTWEGGDIPKNQTD